MHTVEGKEVTQEDVDYEINNLVKMGYHCVIFRGEDLARALGCSAPAVRKRYYKGRLPFLRRDEEGYYAHVATLARYLASKRAQRLSDELDFDPAHDGESQ